MHYIRKKQLLAVRTVIAMIVLFMVGLCFGHRNVYAATPPQHMPAQGTITLAKGKTTHDIFAIGKTIYIHGNVSDNVVALDSTVYIDKGAYVDTLLSVGGNVTIDPLASVHNELVFSPTIPFVNHVVYGVAFVAICLLIQLIASVIIVFVSVLCSVLFKSFARQFIAKPRHVLRQRLGIGFTLTLALVAVVCGFALIGIGIPIAVLITFVTLVAMLIGMVPITTLIGHTVLKNHDNQSRTWMLSLIGSIILVGCLNIPIIGLFLLLGVLFIALGSFIQYAIGFRRSRSRSRSIESTRGE